MTTAEPRFWRPLLVVWLILTAASALWSLATPIGGAPDEPAHFIKAAAVVRGQVLGETTSAGTLVHVPEYVAYSRTQTCYAFHPETTADCSAPDAVPGGTLVAVRTTAGLYDPVYYFLTGWPSLLMHDVRGLYAMRLVSAIIASFFLAITAAQLLRLRRRTIPLLGFAVAVTPMVLFLDGSMNPNALETSTVLAAFVTMFLIVRDPDSSLLRRRAILLLVAASVGVTMRGLSPLWVAIALFAPLVLIRREEVRALTRSWWARVATGIVALVTAGALAWTLVTGSLGSPFTPDGAVQAPGVGASPLTGFTIILSGTIDYAKGMIGDFGWLDTPAPAAVFFVWAALFGALMIVTIAVTRGRARLLILGGLAALVLVPPLLQALYIHNGGLIWQGRYALPLFVCVILVAGLLAAEKLLLPAQTARALAITVSVAWTASQFAAFFTALRRYGVGLTGSISALLRDPSWSPPLGVVPTLVVFALIVAAAGVGLVGATWRADVVRRDSAPAQGDAI